MDNAEAIYQALKPDFAANLKEVNDLIDNDAAYQKYMAQLGSCELCKNKATDEMEFETGNNAEYAVSVALCDDHLKEAEDTGYDFEEKYAEQILECLYENWRGQGDALRDEAKYK